MARSSWQAHGHCKHLLLSIPQEVCHLSYSQDSIHWWLGSRTDGWWLMHRYMRCLGWFWHPIFVCEYTWEEEVGAKNWDILLKTWRSCPIFVSMNGSKLANTCDIFDDFHLPAQLSSYIQLVLTVLFPKTSSIAWPVAVVMRISIFSMFAHSHFDSTQTQTWPLHLGLRIGSWGLFSQQLAQRH